MADKVVTLEKAINSIKTAADEIPADEFISYSTILDVHLTHALEEFSPEDQYELLEAVKEIHKSHEALARDIAWDLVSVLLPFLESSLPKTVSSAEVLIASAAANGNPREVFIKLLESLSNLQWEHEPESDEEDEDAHCSGFDEVDGVSKMQNIDPGKQSKARIHAVKKFEVLISALSTVHRRIFAKFPSRFLSTELSTLLSTFVKAVESLECEATNVIINQLLDFVRGLNPKLRARPTPMDGKRPPLPPRVSTNELPKATAERGPTSGAEEGLSETLLQDRLIISFLTHLLETYLLRTKNQPTEPNDFISREVNLPQSGNEGRGLVVGWAGKYDQEVLRPEKSKVPGGRTQIDEERENRDSLAGVQDIVNEICNLCGDVGIDSDELFELCQTSLDEHKDEDDVGIPTPRVASDVPLSKYGALFVLAHGTAFAPQTCVEVTPNIHVFPEHQKISEAFMIYGTGQNQPAVIDAVLVLGMSALIIQGLGDVPDAIEPFTIYLQIFAVISTNSESPQSRFLAHYHVSTTLRAHPNEAVRLAYIKDTLTHCPFESLKAAAVGILKDEILHAATPVQREGSSVPSTPASIFGTSLCLTEIFDDLFPNLQTLFSAQAGSSDDKGWENFKEVYDRLLATVNFYIFLLLGDGMRERLGVSDPTFGNKVESQFLGPLRKQLEIFGKKPPFEGGTEVGLLRAAMERLQEVKEGV